VPAQYVITTSSIYHEIYQILVEKGTKACAVFCCCPEFQDYGALSRIKARTEKKGSSRITGVSGSDLEEEVLIIPEAVGHSLDNLDLVIDALDQARV